MRLISFVLLSAFCCFASGAFAAATGNSKDSVDIVGSRQVQDALTSANALQLDPSSVLEDPKSSMKLLDDDIEEDPRDRFFTTRSGKRRPTLVSDGDWAEEVSSSGFNRSPAGSLPNVLSRKKRCGGGGGDGGGDANRARRARRVRARRRQQRRAAKARRAARRAQARATTTVTRQVIQNGQVVSQTTETRAAPAAVVSTIPQQPQVVQVPATPVVLPAATLSGTGSVQVG